MSKFKIIFSFIIALVILSFGICTTESFLSFFDYGVKNIPYTKYYLGNVLKYNTGLGILGYIYWSFFCIIAIIVLNKGCK